MGQSNGTSTPSRAARGLTPTLRLLLFRARRTWGFRGATVLGGLGVVLGLVFLAIVRGARSASTEGALSALPSMFAHAVCWGIATLAVFGTEQRAYTRDHEDGIRSLLGARGYGRHYGFARVVTAVTSTAFISIGCTSVLAVATALAATGTGEAGRTWLAAFSAIVYSACFSVLLGTLGLAVLGGRGRGGGYLGLLTILVLPELLEPLSRRALRLPFGETVPVSLPSILNAVAKPASVANFVCGFSVACVVAGLGYAYAERERARIDREVRDAARPR
ncbi:MAG: hypothetical protein U0174_11680 [Polyangiaceae bacterium]